ncbi:hypothetical protein KEJ39_02510 [Candidatus Bathyarchaeota archaeon]|nr:hypothetical protein [Candidatus Bathyarchaeota archaeon]
MLSSLYIAEDPEYKTIRALLNPAEPETFPRTTIIDGLMTGWAGRRRPTSHAG